MKEEDLDHLKQEVLGLRRRCAEELEKRRALAALPMPVDPNVLRHELRAIQRETSTARAAVARALGAKFTETNLLRRRLHALGASTGAKNNNKQAFGGGGGTDVVDRFLHNLEDLARKQTVPIHERPPFRPAGTPYYSYY